MMRFRFRQTPRKMAVYPGAGQEGRLKRLRQIVTGLIRYERVEPNYSHADEARQYAERLIYLAIKNGDKHRETMETADFWLLEKDLIHKLFKVLVPRYQNYKTCFTDLHKLPVEYPGPGNPKGLLELRGNPWPPVMPRPRETKHFLTNQLLAAARHDIHAARQQKWQEASPSSAASSSSSSSSSANSPSSPHLSSSLSSSSSSRGEMDNDKGGSSVDDEAFSSSSVDGKPVNESPNKR